LLARAAASWLKQRRHEAKTMKIVDRVFAWILLVLGCIHCAATFAVHKALTLDAVWFFSGGLVMILGALLNLLRAARPEDGLVVRISLLANLLLFALFVIVVPWVLRNDIRQNPQVIAVGVTVAAEFFFSLKLFLSK
jgi:Ca2+/Na+ antiporter